jgi:hypothetical protein
MHTLGLETGIGEVLRLSPGLADLQLGFLRRHSQYGFSKVGYQFQYINLAHLKVLLLLLLSF